MIKEDIYLYNEPLSKHTTFRIGGPAKFWVEPRDIDELRDILKNVNSRDLKYRVIGNGSNILIRDNGVPWIVIRLSNFKGMSIEGSTIKASSGVALNELVRSSVRNNLSGLEFLAGIPGTVGGAVKTNAGAYGKQISDILKEIEIIDKNGDIHTIPREKIIFKYRYSNISEATIILSAVFNVLVSSYKAVNNKIGKILEKRNTVFPLEFANAGSIFKNPEGITVGELIDEIGLKSTVRGRAMINNKHANIIVNLGGASSRDVLELITYVQTKVYQETGINLELEIELW